MKSFLNRIILLPVLFLFALHIHAQHAEYVFGKDNSEVSVLVNINRAKLSEEDKYNKKRGMPLRIATNYPLEMAFDTIGVWKTKSDEGKEWKFRMNVPGAQGLIVSFSDFYIPPGGNLFVYDINDGRDKNSWVYTHEDNPRGGAYSLEVYYQDNIVFEYVAPFGLTELPRFTSSTLGYKYNGDLSGFNHSVNSCMVNVNCPSAIEWQKEKMGIIRLRVNTTSGIYACTGSLVNNTKGDKVPYVLTAAHCFRNGTVADVVNTEFFFDYEFPGCSNSTVRPQYKYHKGAELLVMNPMSGGSDGALVKMTQDIPDEWNVYFNGWALIDTDNVVKDGSVIHHPAGDVKKISFYDGSLTTDRWYENGVYSAENAHWVTKYKTGSTAGGSSGAPIFDDDGLIVGTLTGGDALCTGTNPNNGTDYYGKMAYHWDKSADSNQHMKTYLDPDNTGVTSIMGIFNNDDFEKELILSAASVSMEEISITDVLIVKGNGNYKVTSSDPNIATASINDITVIIEGKNIGTTTLIITDKLGKTANINVQVTPMTVIDLELAEDTIRVGKGRSYNVPILKGSGNYEVTSSNSNVTSATIETDVVEVKGLNLGEAKLIVTDRAKQNATIVVNVRQDVEIYATGKSHLYVKINDNEDVIRFINIADMSGRVLYSIKNVNLNEYDADITGIGGGVFLVMVKTQKRKTETRKVAWQK